MHKTRNARLPKMRDLAGDLGSASRLALVHDSHHTVSHSQITSRTQHCHYSHYKANVIFYLNSFELFLRTGEIFMGLKGPPLLN